MLLFCNQPSKSRQRRQRRGGGSGGEALLGCVFLTLLETGCCDPRCGNAVWDRLAPRSFPTLRLTEASPAAKGCRCSWQRGGCALKINISTAGKNHPCSLCHGEPDTWGGFSGGSDTRRSYFRFGQKWRDINYSCINNRLWCPSSDL